ncbi:SDR family NAD(P)-dependent oxidoreductase [Roseovarius faecimaris]|uniref:SDR family NAD(P)-dependent oxidoreductase n=1 Tax=Roseovarius faecimaris TaxID=2494550 RepID=A0A6I6IRP4_9RHOB|nr:SDR family NAD(P)-dependent oxidoreductase [Roseovarius faecimaris]QGX97936.1 SDR family NAD(P)-dependent oxidoreductase [Roseovarius faecimaris]
MFDRLDPARRTALVTGGNRGIGKAIARGLLERDLNVIIACRDAEDGTRVADEMGAHFVYCDLSAPMVLPPEGAEVDVLVNNAGVCFDAPLLSRKAEFEEVMNVMVTGPYELIRQVVPGMRQRGYGRIVNVSSGWGSFGEGLEGPGAYGVAKAALNALTVAVAREVPDDIKVNAMCPGWVRTRMGGQGATRSPEEGADTALWLACLDDDGPTGGFFRDRKPIDW